MTFKPSKSKVQAYSLIPPPSSNFGKQLGTTTLQVIIRQETCKVFDWGPRWDYVKPGLEGSIEGQYDLD